MTKKQKHDPKKKKSTKQIDEVEVKEEKEERKGTRSLYLLSLLFLGFLGINGYLIFTEPSSVKEMYDYNSKVEIERMKLAEYKEKANPEDQTKYDKENHQLETTLKEKQTQAEKYKKTAEIAKKAQEDLEKKVKDLTAIKDSNDLTKYLDALNGNTYPTQNVTDRGTQRQAFESQVPQGGVADEEK